MDMDEFKQCLWNYSREINENTNRIFNPIIEQFGLTTLQFRILMGIRQSGSHTIGSLANEIKMAGTNISTMCKKLEKMALLERIRKPEDERVVLVILTQKGQDIVSEIDQIIIKKITLYTKAESEQTMHEIIIGLKQLNKLLQKMGQTEKY
ncbi:MarR family winged helix-turn-helix transcriptional regulator [Bacillus sp. SD088]|uniref:MarR family winged helix-turn-helix transcriptional regulator n=1 Tax=Bacillus sp. SD088 TaxID=2782012 RepID=UPI001A97468E|nr:MarR family transcriptional regulator [Bacillus sp. SD088]MBO0992555.1 MarR family transcriptional regulator [Bacillus sp. SD088]